VPFEELDTAAKRAHSDGDYARMHEIAERMRVVAGTADQRGLAALRLAGAWDGLGRYPRQLEAIQEGLADEISNDDLRALLQANLANSYYTLWRLYEACGMAREIQSEFETCDEPSRNVRAAHAFSWYVLGHAHRRMIAQQPKRAAHFAQRAHDALGRAIELYTALADEFDHNPWRGIANTCTGGQIEVEVELEQRVADDALAALAGGLDAVSGDNEDGLAGDRLESFGWWCIFGCNITLRHLADRSLQKSMALFTNKGYEIADRLNNWAMRERLFTMEFIQRQRLNDLAGFEVDWMIDSEEVRTIVGTMGRFPSFRQTGWRILQTATVVDSN
jgi:hypothetical protein